MIGEPVLLLRPPTSLNDKQAEWESRSVTSHEVNRRWTEGSVTFRKDDTYYIMYSANNFAGQIMQWAMALQNLRWGHLQKRLTIPYFKKI